MVLPNLDRLVVPSRYRKPVYYWTDPQREILESQSKLLVAWGANGIGKSFVLGELARRAIKRELPGQRREPQTVMLVGRTWKQLSETLGYFMDDEAKRWFRPGTRFEGGAIKGQRIPIFDIVAGPGKGGRLILGIFKAEGLAGFRAHVVLSDEPLPESVHTEMFTRGIGRNGRMIIVFTPTLGTAHKIDYLWDIVDNPGIPWATEIQTELTIENVTPRGGLVEHPWMTQEEIDQIKQGLSAHEADMRLGLCRAPKLDNAYFSAWGPHLRQDWEVPPRTPLAVGIDHGSKPGAQRASLVAVAGTGLACHVHVMGHYRGDGRTQTVDDARGIIRMIEDAGQRIEDVDLWIGDRAHDGGRWGAQKDNGRLREAIAQALGFPTHGRGWLEKIPKPLREIKTPRKYDGSVIEGCSAMHRMMVDQRFTLATDASCDPLDTDISVWNFSRTHPAKDGIDSVRYPAVPMSEGRSR